MWLPCYRLIGDSMPRPAIRESESTFFVDMDRCAAASLKREYKLGAGNS